MTDRNSEHEIAARIAATAPRIAVSVGAVLRPYQTAIWHQVFGRALRWRVVHAQRARALRRRGEDVRFSHISPTGRAVYRWHKQPRWLDFEPVGVMTARPSIQFKDDPLLEAAREGQWLQRPTRVTIPMTISKEGNEA